MSDEQPSNEKIDVEGHGFRGQAKRFFKRGEDAEAPESSDLEQGGAKDAEAGAGDDPDVEGHPFTKMK